MIGSAGVSVPNAYLGALLGAELHAQHVIAP